jgi:hypothetical protein
MRPFFHRDLFTTDLDEADRQAWRQKHRPPPSMKKAPVFPLILAGVLIAFLWSILTGCTTIEVIAPDGTITRTQAPSPGVLPFAAAAITAYSPRPIIVRQEKSGRITPEEIQQRWRPATPPHLTRHHRHLLDQP